MHLLRGLVLGFVALFVLTGSVIAADRAIIILDASGSMWAQIDGKSRIEIARETLNTVLKGVPDSLELGFMAYGHRQKNSCADIELLVPPAAGTAAEISQAAAGISPKGMTPLKFGLYLLLPSVKMSCFICQGCQSFLSNSVSVFIKYFALL